MRNMRKKLSIIIVVFIVLVGGTITLALWNGNQHFDNGSTAIAVEAIGKVGVAEILGNSISLQETDVNSILGMYIGNGKSEGNVTIKGLAVSFGENSMVIKTPVEYKGVNVMISAGGKSTYLPNEKNIDFQPSYYKIGILPVPKLLAETLLKKHSIKGVEINNDSIKISASLIPFSIQGIAFKDKSIVLDLTKADTFGSILPNSVKTKSAAVAPQIDASNSSPKSNTSALDQGKTTTAAKSSAATKNSVSKVDSQIAVAASTLQSNNEKEVLQKMRATMSSMSANPATNYTSDVTQVTSSYKALTEDEKNRVKSALLSNVDINAALKLKTTFGL